MMKGLFDKIKRSWRKILSAAAVLLIFLAPVSRSVLAKVVKSTTNAADKQSPVQENRGWGNSNNNSHSSHNSHCSHNSQSSNSYPSVSYPSSGTPVSPMSNSGPSISTSHSGNSGPSRSDSHSGSSGPGNNPKPKRK